MTTQQDTQELEHTSSGGYGHIALYDENGKLIKLTVDSPDTKRISIPNAIDGQLAKPQENLL